MDLTLIEVVAIIHHGKVEHSPLALEYIKAVKEKTGLDVFCCYATTYLSVYLRKSFRELKVHMNEYKKVLFEIFSDLLKSKGIDNKYAVDNMVLDSFDGLAMYHYLSDSQAKANSLFSVLSMCAKVYCGWDEARECMTYYLIVSDERMKMITDIERSRVNQELLEMLHRRDKNNVVNDDFKPIYTTWSALSPEMRFALSRG